MKAPVGQLATTRSVILALVLAVLSAAAIAAVVDALGEPTDGGNGSPLDDNVLETEGDWTVDAGAPLSYTNTTIVLNGNLTVSLGGTLSLSGVTLLVNTTGPAPYFILIEPTATLVVMDRDGSALTTGDASVIKAFSYLRRYTVEVQQEGVLHLLRSSMSDIGPEGTLGMMVSSDEVLLEDATVSAFSSILVESADPKFSRVSFEGMVDSSLYFSASAAVLDHITVTDCYEGLNIKGSPSPAVTNLTTTNCFVALNLESSSMSIRGGELRATLYGVPVRLNQTSSLRLIDVTLDEPRVELKDDTSTLEVRWSLAILVVDHDFVPVEGAMVMLNDSLGETVWEGATGPDGLASTEVLDHIRTLGGVDARNPHTILVTKDRYRATGMLPVTSTMTHEMLLTTNLVPVIELRSPRPGTRVVVGQPLLLDATGSYDPNGDPLTYRWTTNQGGRVLYEGALPSTSAALLMSESTITLTVLDGLGGVNTTSVQVVVLQATAVMLTVDRPLYNATLQATYGGTGSLDFVVADPQPPYGAELIGVFVAIVPSGEVIFAAGTIDIRYSASLLPFGMNETSLVLARDDAGMWLPVLGSEVNVPLHTVSAPVSSVGVYAIKGVIPPNIPPRLRMLEAGVMVVPHDVEARVGTEVTVQFAAEDELPAFAVLDVSGLPSGIEVDRTTKRLWGTMPATAGTWTLILSLTDSGGLNDTASIHLAATGEMPVPQLWSASIDPPSGDVLTVFMAKVLYRSDLGLAPAFVVVDVDGKRYDMVPEDPMDHDWAAGVMFVTYLQLDYEGDPYTVVFNASDGARSNLTAPIKLRVGWPSYAPTTLETIIIIVTILAIVAIILVIRLTSRRYDELRTAHVGKDSEERIDYIKPEKKAPKGGKGPGEGAGEGRERKGEGEVEGAKEGKQPPGAPGATEAPETTPAAEEGGTVVKPPDGPPPEAKTAPKPGPKGDLGPVDTEVDHLDTELEKLDEEIEEEEETLEKIDSDIDGIIDELEGDKRKAA